LQLQVLRDQSKQLESQLNGMQNDILREEQDLSILCLQLQHLNMEDPQYVCVTVVFDNL